MRKREFIKTQLIKDVELLQQRVLELEGNESGENNADSARRHAEELLASVIDNIPAVIVIKDARELKIIHVNKATEEFFGYSRTEMIGKAYHELVLCRERDDNGVQDREVLRLKHTVDIPEETIHTKHKGLRILHTQKIPLFDEQGRCRYLLEVSDDITEHSIAQEALRLLEPAVQQSSESIILAGTNLQGDGPVILFVNPAYTAMTGYTAEETLGKSLFLMSGVFEDNALLERLRECLREGQRFHAETKSHRSDGTDFILEWSISPIKDENGSITHLLSIQRDVTDRARAAEELKQAYVKLKEMQRDLIQSEKMAALGRFSSGVAHEVKNPLGIILGGSEYLERKLADAEEDARTAVAKIKDATLRADAIIHGLLEFARPSELQLELVRPEALIEETLALIRYRAPLSNITITKDFSSEKMQIYVDKGQLQQVFFNLFINAIDALPSGGTVTVKTSLPHAGEQQHPVCIIEVCDDGEGISPDNLAKLFEPFFTTKRDKKGVGLGLCMVKMIVDNHKGTLKIDSQLGKGTTVKLSFPLAKKGDES